MGEAAGVLGAVAHLEARDQTGDLIRQVAGGDAEAFARLYDDVAPLIYGLACRVVRNEALAEEVTQDVLTSIWQQAGRFDAASGSGRTWVLMIAHRRAVDRVRSEQASRNRNDRYGRGMTARPFDEVLETVETSFDHHAVSAALESLTGLQRQAVTLAYFGGHTYREVAELLGVPLGTVKTRIREGLLALRRSLESTDAFAANL